MRAWYKRSPRETSHAPDETSSVSSGDLSQDQAERDSLNSRVHDEYASDQCLPSRQSDPPTDQNVSEEDEEPPQKKKMFSLKTLSHRFIKRKKSASASLAPPSTRIEILPNGTRVSPPVSPILDRRHFDPQGSPKSSSHKHSFTAFPDDVPLGSELTSLHPAEYYAEKLEVYKLKYSYLKSWPGLLRLLAGLQLLFGGMVFACVCAYLQKDSEWSNFYNPLGGYDPSGYYYNGPMTAFVLAIVGLAWIVTVILLVLGLTMYYRTILLDSQWWPLTEALINVVIFLLYMSAGIVYVNDLSRGGLCYSTIGFNPIMTNLCRVDGGQMAGTAFVFINMLMYLLSFLVGLRMWRHEAARRERQALANRVPRSYTSEAQTMSKRIVPQEEEDDQPAKEHKLNYPSGITDAPITLSGAIPMGYIPKPRIIADYILKYPDIYSAEDREQYRAVFNDQYQEYKELHRDVSAALQKFHDLGVMINRLLNNVNNPMEQQRIDCMLQLYEKKKNDPSLIEKKERCEYLKAKLRHIKTRIQNFDQSIAAKGQP